MKKLKKKIYFVVGPTSSGKTAFSVELAKKIGNGEIVCCDSRQVYKELDIGSGKVTEAERQGVPHHLLDVATLGKRFTVINYVNLALKKIKEIYSRGNIPIVSGGTGFYIDALLYKYNLPKVKVNKKLRAELQNQTIEKLQEIFKHLTRNLAGNYLEKFAAKEFYNNRNRLIRTIEIVKQLGYMPELKKIPRFPENKYDVEFCFTDANNATLREKIRSRTLERLKQGMLEEFAKLIKKYKLSEKYIQAMGYEFSLMHAYLQNKIDYQTFLEKFISQELRYAKRQKTWFKRYR